MPASFGRRLGAATLAIAASAALAGPAQAALVSHSAPGDVNADNDYPTWYQDDAGLRLQQCVDGTDQCILVPGELAGVPGDPEIFWWAAESTITNGGASAELVMALEGAQDDPPPLNFGRYQLIMDGFAPNTTYAVTTPLGTLNVTTDGTGSIDRFRDEIGCDADPCDFDAALGSSIGPFLRWDPAIAPAAPAGYVGDPATPHEVVGSPTGNNVFRITAPDGTVAGETDLFTVMGKIADGAPAPTASSDDWGPRALSFANMTVGQSTASQSVTVRNTGLVNMTVGAPTFSGPGAADYRAVNGCPLAPAGLGAFNSGGATCSIAVVFTPSAAGARAATMTFPTGAANGDGDTATGSTRTVALSGTGVAVPPPAQTQTQTTTAAQPAPTVTQQSTTPAVVLAPALNRIGVPATLRLSSAKARGITLRLGSANANRVAVRILRNGRVVYRKTVATGNQVKLNSRALRRLLRRGRYTIQLTPIAASGQRGATITRRLTISR